MRDIVSVIGGGACAPGEYERAREVGRRLAQAGFVVLTGGLGGVMEAASRGAAEAGGLAVGILPGLDHGDANPWVEIALPTGLSDARNIIVATAGRAVVAVGGGLGTLSEIAFALKRGLPVVSLGSWPLDGERMPDRGPLVARTPEEAVDLVVRSLREEAP
ncbi:MAG: TIGR00725 family protein [Planctomycetes bacterium]|nr:TIGR00725 family protein [Planctomycetota bacterium]